MKVKNCNINHRDHQWCNEKTSVFGTILNLFSNFHLIHVKYTITCNKNSFQFDEMHIRIRDRDLAFSYLWPQSYCGKSKRVRHIGELLKPFKKRLDNLQCIQSKAKRMAHRSRDKLNIYDTRSNEWLRCSYIHELLV